MFDTDGSGAIGSEELKGAMQSIGLEADDDEIERLIREVGWRGGLGKGSNVLPPPQVDEDGN